MGMEGEKTCVYPFEPLCECQACMRSGIFLRSIVNENRSWPINDTIVPWHMRYG